MSADAWGRAPFGGGSLHYVRIGRGPEVVLVHGLASDLAFWYLGVARILAATHTVTAFDLRGHGYSDMPPSGYTSADLAADTLELMNYLEIERAHLVGHSFGGSVALEVALAWPERVASLVLADARVNALQGRLPAVGDGRWERIDRELRRIGLDLPERLPAVAYAVLEELLEAGKGEREVAARLFGGGPAAGRKLQRWLRLMDTTTARTDFHAVAGLTVERLSALATPVLGVYGERSSCMTSCEGLRRHLPAAVLAVEPGLGHLHPFLAPESFHRHLVGFLGSPEVSACA